MKRCLLLPGGSATSAMKIARGVSVGVWEGVSVGASEGLDDGELGAELGACSDAGTVDEVGVWVGC